MSPHRALPRDAWWLAVVTCFACPAAGCMTQSVTRSEPRVVGRVAASPPLPSLSRAGVRPIAAEGGAWLELHYEVSCTQQVDDQVEVQVQRQKRFTWVPYAGLGAGALGIVLGAVTYDTSSTQGSGMSSTGGNLLLAGAGFLIGSGIYMLAANTSVQTSTEAGPGQRNLMTVACVDSTSGQPLQVELALEGKVVAGSVEPGSPARFWVDPPLQQRFSRAPAVTVLIGGVIAGSMDLRGVSWPGPVEAPPATPELPVPGAAVSPPGAAANPSGSASPGPLPAATPVPPPPFGAGKAPDARRRTQPPAQPFPARPR